MRRLLPFALLLPFAACADVSQGAALNECHLQYYALAQADQARLIPDCMRNRSYAMVPGCAAVADPDNWEWQVPSMPYDNPQCYRPVGAKAWVATTLSPL
jgi:hypothetical protein